MNKKNLIEHNDLPELFAAVMRHPDLPHGVREYILDGICALETTTEMYENPEVLREIFGLNEPKKVRLTVATK